MKFILYEGNVKSANWTAIGASKLLYAREQTRLREGKLFSDIFGGNLKPSMSVTLATVKQVSPPQEISLTQDIVGFVQSACPQPIS